MPGTVRTYMSLCPFKNFYFGLLGFLKTGLQSLHLGIKWKFMRKEEEGGGPFKLQCFLNNRLKSQVYL